MKLLEQIIQLRHSGNKAFAVLIDPDKPFNEQLISLSDSAGAAFFLVGGSDVKPGAVQGTIEVIRDLTKTPVLLFPGHPNQFSPSADGILLPCLISGRNANLLIGYHVQSAQQIRNSGMEVISAGYLLTGDNTETSVARISATQPIPEHRPETIVSTAMAGEMLGLKTIYLEAGSGAAQPVNPAVISAVRKNTHCPLMVGGGLRSAEQAKSALEAGADLLVIGNLLEKDPYALAAIADEVMGFRSELSKP